MERTSKQLYYPTMAQAPAVSHFPVSLYATSSPLEQELFYTVPRAGHLVGGPDHHVRRDHFPGHELIMCLGGTGFVRVQGRSHRVSPGDLVWIDCQQPHEHGALAEDPWEVYWIRAEGLSLGRMGQALRIGSSPVFGGFDTVTAAPIYREIFALMQEGRGQSSAMIHAAVARLVALAFLCRQVETTSPSAPVSLQKAIEQMSLFYFQPQRAARLAALCGLSPSHFTRLFRATFGTSPIDWLRRERINQAKRRLAATTDSIERVAEQVGYNDRFFFSKDFKRLAGLTPREFRRREALGR